MAKRLTGPYISQVLRNGVRMAAQDHHSEEVARAACEGYRDAIQRKQPPGQFIISYLEEATHTVTIFDKFTIEPPTTYKELVSMVEELVETYWGEGDSDPDNPPDIIIRAKELLKRAKGG